MCVPWYIFKDDVGLVLFVPRSLLSFKDDAGFCFICTKICFPSRMIWVWFCLYKDLFSFKDDTGLVLFVPRSVLFKDDVGLVLSVRRCIFFFQG